jgi:hypothetical protein
MATYYISNTGSDAANGTSTGTPWQTIAKVNGSSFNPGDNILFKRGDMWREQLTVPSSGSAGNYITFGAYGTGALPIISGFNTTTGWTNAGSNQWWVNNPNVVTTRAMVVIGGTLYNEQTSLAAVNAANEYFIDVTATPDRIYVYSTVDPATLGAEISNRDYCIRAISSKHHLIFEDLEVRGSGKWGLYLEGPSSTYGTVFDGATIVRRCKGIYNRYGSFVHIDHHNNVLFEDCQASYSGNGFYSWQADGGTFRRCISANNFSFTINPNFTDGHGIGVYESTGWVVEHCNSTGDAYGFLCDLNLQANTSGIVRYNKVFTPSAGSGCIGVDNVGTGGTVQVYYNLMINGATGGFENYTTNSGLVNVYNNTMYTDAAHGTQSVAFLNHGAGFTFKNNLVVRDYVEFLPTMMNVDSTAADMDNNNYFIYNGVGSTMRNYFNGVNRVTLATWRTATGEDANAISADPLFVNKASDWRLQSGSPCINAGVSVGLTHDLLGHPITGNPDIGCYEYMTTVTKRGRKAAKI